MNIKQPFISIVIPTWNRVDQVINAVNSIPKEFDFENEIIVNDNFSDISFSDNLTKHFENRPSVKVFRNQRHVSMTENWNISLKKAKGDWITLLCSDDEFLPENFRDFRQYLKTVKNYYLILQNPSNVKIEMLKAGYKSVKKINLPIASGNFINKKILVDNEYFDDRLKYSPDGEYWYRLASKYNTILYAGKIAKYNVHDKNYMWENWTYDDIIDQMILINTLNAKHKNILIDSSDEKIKWDHYKFFVFSSAGSKVRSKVFKKYFRKTLIYCLKNFQFYYLLKVFGAYLFRSLKRILNGN